jgi:hypothetical protein
MAGLTNLKLLTDFFNKIAPIATEVLHCRETTRRANRVTFALRKISEPFHRPTRQTAWLVAASGIRKPAQKRKWEQDDWPLQL